MAGINCMALTESRQWWWTMHSWWMVLGGTILAALCLWAGSWVPRRRRYEAALDKVHDEAWERCAAKIRRQQLDKLRAGLVLAMDEHGPRWFDPLAGVVVPRLGSYVREMIGAEWAPNQSRLPNDRQVRAELAAIAGDKPGEGSSAEERPGAHKTERDAGRFDSSPLTSSTPALTPPSVGAGPEPPGPDGASVGAPVTTAACAAVSELLPVKADSPGPGDPLFAALDDRSTFALIQWELARLARVASEPFKLTEWRMA